jgi:molybdopterin/thiamine biosynthesis adenylyltransferase
MGFDAAVLARAILKLADKEGEEPGIGVQDVHGLAAAHGVSCGDVERAALKAGVAPRRYSRNLGSIGMEGQERLLRATVCVVGLGGLGGYVLEGLARMGVGHLILVDEDEFEETNLNRQVLSVTPNLGHPKVRAAIERLALVNDAVEATGMETRASAANVGELLAGAEVVVDCLDSLPSRLMLQDAAQGAGIPFVHGSVAGFLGQVMTILPGDAGLRALYPPGRPLPERGAEAELGTPAATPMAVAAWQIQEVVKLLLAKGELLRNRLLVMDMESLTIHLVSVVEPS